MATGPCGRLRAKRPFARSLTRLVSARGPTRSTQSFRPCPPEPQFEIGAWVITLGGRDVEHHHPAMTAPLRRFAEPSPHYSRPNHLKASLKVRTSRANIALKRGR